MEVTPKSTLEALVELCRRTHDASQRHTANAVNKGLVIRNYLLGHHIVAFEQGGEDRAPYGATLLEDLSARLSADIGRGFSVDSLEQMRRFYLTYGPADGAEISETPSRKLHEGPTLIPETVSRIFKRKKDALVEITLPENANIHASEYQLYLPSKEEFKAQIDRAVETVEDHGREADQ